MPWSSQNRRASSKLWWPGGVKARGRSAVGCLSLGSYPSAANPVPGPWAQRLARRWPPGRTNPPQPDQISAPSPLSGTPGGGEVQLECQDLGRVRGSSLSGVVTPCLCFGGVPADKCTWRILLRRSPVRQKPFSESSPRPSWPGTPTAPSCLWARRARRPRLPTDPRPVSAASLLTLPGLWSSCYLEEAKFNKTQETTESQPLALLGRQIGRRSDGGASPRVAFSGQ